MEPRTPANALAVTSAPRRQTAGFLEGARTNEHLSASIEPARFLAGIQVGGRCGSGFGTKIIAGSSGTSGTETLSHLQFSQAAVQFSAALSPAISRTTVAVVVQEAHTGSITTVGTLRSLATRVFSSQP